jgi:hypothetical protein
MQHLYKYNIAFCQYFFLKLDPLAFENECAPTLTIHT